MIPRLHPVTAEVRLPNQRLWWLLGKERRCGLTNAEEAELRRLMDAMEAQG